MACSLPHTVEKIKEYVQKQCDMNDAARWEAIIVVSKLFNKEYHAKQALKEQYAECKDVPSKRRVVIEKILHDDSMKDLEDLQLSSLDEDGSDLGDEMHLIYTFGNGIHHHSTRYPQAMAQAIAPKSADTSAKVLWHQNCYGTTFKCLPRWLKP
ncbi:hypothetical protein Tco_0287309 [Tanacetum coccineum]